MKGYLVLCLFLVSQLSVNLVSGLAVMSVDLGSEWLKVAIVSPGKPMEIALNLDSARKTPLVVAFRDGERFFGEAALTAGVRFPEKTFIQLLDLVGKRIDSPAVTLYKQRFPFYNVTGDESRGTILLHHPDGMTFTPEELIAMILQKAKFFAEQAAEGQTIKDAVITVPPYFNQAERRSLIHSAELAGLKVLQLMNSNTGVALNYGVFRRKDFNETVPTYVLFYDMGASSTSATVVSYQMVKTKERGFLESNPQLAVKGVGFDRNLGGFEMQLRLRDYLAKLFAEQRGKSLDSVVSNKRAMSKLLKEAGRLKKVLSANTEHMSQVENVMDDLDLKSLVKRSEFEELCSDLLDDSVTKPVETALKSASITIDDISQVILFGGNTRVPKVQQILSAYLGGKDLGKSVNSDEASALGAVYQAAFLSKGFKVKTFVVKEANIYPIQVDFSRDVEQEDGTLKRKLMQRTLFSRNNVYPQKKILTFSRHTNDFDFYINYGDLTSFLTDNEIGQLGPLNISKVTVKGVSEVIAKHENQESKGIKAHFKMDESGLLTLDHIEAVFEAKVEEQVTGEDSSNVVGDAIAKFGSTISKLFGRSGEEIPEGGDTPVEEINTPANETESETVNATESSQHNAQNGTQGQPLDVNATQANVTKTKTEIKVKTFKEPVQLELHSIDFKDMTNEESADSILKLKELNEKESDKLARDQVRNSFESFIHETKMKLFEPEYEVATSDEDRESILKDLNSAQEWLEYESDHSDTKTFHDKLAEMKATTRDMFERVKEHRDRPEALKSLKEMLNISRMFMNGAQNVSAEDQIFTDVEINTLTSLIDNTEKWMENAVNEQAKMPLNVSPKLTVKQIAEKLNLLDREVKYLLNKARITPPKRKIIEPEPVSNTTDNEEIGPKNEKMEEKAKEPVLEGGFEIPDGPSDAKQEEKLDHLRRAESQQDSNKENEKDEHSQDKPHSEL